METESNSEFGGSPDASEEDEEEPQDRGSPANRYGSFQNVQALRLLIVKKSSKTEAGGSSFMQVQSGSRGSESWKNEGVFSEQPECSWL